MQKQVQTKLVKNLRQKQVLKYGLKEPNLTELLIFLMTKEFLCLLFS